MNINQISSVNSKANPLKNAKNLNIPLRDGKEGILRFNNNAYEYLVVKNNKIAGGMGHYSPNGIPSYDWIKLFDKINGQIKEGFDFITEFTKANLAK